MIQIQDCPPVSTRHGRAGAIGRYCCVQSIERDVAIGAIRDMYPPNCLAESIAGPLLEGDVTGAKQLAVTPLEQAASDLPTCRR